MASKENTLEGGTDAVTISNANSGGASGDAFSNVGIGTGCVNEYDTLRASHGSVSAHLTVGGTSAEVRVGWASLGSVPEVFTRFYLWLPSAPALPVLVNRFINAAFSTSSAIEIVDSGGPKLRLYNAGLGSGVNGAVNVTRDAWVRIEVRILCNATTGILEAKLFNTPESSTPDETVTRTNINTSTNVEFVQFGVTQAVTNRELWLDSIKYDTAAYPGPFSPGAPAAVARRSLLGVGV